jgi:uncharacterized membrane protein SirB2
MTHNKRTISTKKQILLIGVALMSLGGFSVVNTLDVNLMIKLYGILFTCQLGFLLFFLSRVRFRKRVD